ncbi:M90 family metallopeptidase [Craterilacuibacter sinensis]|uniref:M90 family metallopeptidase n=1 Tax=Craterilacuibacter sinensis TaxID=2686017 RepID=UPI001F2764E6|nr:M90 family metallopeptidase [Craterilacuibacter sinensis]
MFWKNVGADHVRARKLQFLRDVMPGLPLLAGLSEEDCTRLAELALLFIDSKSLLRVDGESLEDQDAAELALQAVLPVLALGESALVGWQEVVLYPAAFVTRDAWLDDMGLAHEGEQVLIGQARQDGPLLLSLPDVMDSPLLDGWNVVIHEMAHKLDMLDGDANGCPPLHKGMDRAQWAHDWQTAYQAFGRQLAAGAHSWLDPYAAEHPAEFFAVLSECFFETPHWIKADYPTLYAHLSAFYRQDTLARLPASQSVTI